MFLRKQDERPVVVGDSARMTVEQIASAVARGESETLEMKLTTGQRREAMRTVCGMLNHLGGYVVFGVAPGGQIVGQQVSDRTIEELAQELRDIDPPAAPAIDRVPLENGRECLVINVPASRGGPYTYRGRAYRRIGNTTRELSRSEYTNMLLERTHNEQRWENQHATDWSIADLDCAEIVRTIEEAIRRGRMAEPGTREPAEILRGLGLMRGGRLLRAALVLFGNSEALAALPQCLLRVARFTGTDKSQFADNRQFRGNAFELLLAAERFLLAHVPVAGRIVPGSLARIDEPLYPVLATREALVNAFCHRDYAIAGGSVGVAMFDDRLEITSSGSLHFGLTPEILLAPHESRPWNPLIANVFYRRGIIESWGRGTLKMAEITAAAGLPPPEIDDRATCVTVTFRCSRDATARHATRLTPRQERLLGYLACAAQGAAAVREIASALAVSAAPWTIREDLATLKALGLVEGFGWGRGARWKLKAQ